MFNRNGKVLFKRYKQFQGFICFAYKHKECKIPKMALALQYCEHGEPLDVLHLKEIKLKKQLSSSEVLVKVLCAPINPSDVNIIQGKYPIKPEKLPATAGNEFVGEVVCIGNNVNFIKPCERVIAVSPCLGTWTTYGIYDECDLFPIPENVPLAEAATLTVNPCTAYRLLKNFVDLKKGDTVIQNGANSSVGRAVIQLCKEWKLNCVGIVRKRPEKELHELKDELKSIGAKQILTEDEIKCATLFGKGKLKAPSLALNCIGGKSSHEIARHLENKGVLVTYGGMSMEPVMIGTTPLIFKNICARGFWITQWVRENVGTKEWQKMLCDLMDLSVRNKFNAAPYELVPLDQFKEGAASALYFKKDGFSGKKVLLTMDGICVDEPESGKNPNKKK